MLKYFLHRQTFIVCFSKFSLFESQSGQPFKKCSTPRFFKCIISEANVHCRNFRNESVSMLKHSKMNKKRNTKCPPRRPKLQLALFTFFFEESQLQLMFYVFEVAIVVPLFSFFSSFFVCTIPRFAHSLFNMGLLLSSLGSSEGAPPPPLQSCFLAFYTDIDSIRVEQQQLSPNRDNHSRNAARLFSLRVQFPRSTSIAGIFATSLSACRSIRK